MLKSPMQPAASASSLAVTATVGTVTIPTKTNDQRAAYVQVSVSADPVFLLPGQSDITLAAASVAATGTITFTGLPSENDTITVNGVVFTFKAAPVAATDIDIKTDATTQAAEVVAVLSASTNPLLTLASYDNAAGVLTVTHIGHGSRGNAFTLAESAANCTVSGATLTGGVNGGLVVTTAHPVVLNVVGCSHIAAICAATETSTMTVTPLENQ
jgi:hypothetical protein